MSEGFAMHKLVESYLRGEKLQCNTKVKSKVKHKSRLYVYKDEKLWRISKHQRLQRVLMSEEEVQEILTRYHEENNHAGRGNMLEAISQKYYWGRATPDIRKKVKACATCVKRNTQLKPCLLVQYCMAYGCESNSSHNGSGTTFYRFPKDPGMLEKWLSVTHRDKASLRPSCCLCSKHFQDNSFYTNEEGTLTLKEDAVPTITSHPAQEEVPMTSAEDFVTMNNLEDLLTVSNATETMDLMEPINMVEHVEHQYSLPPLESNRKSFWKGKEYAPKKYSKDPCFIRYDQVAQYLTNGVLPNIDSRGKYSLRRMAKSYHLNDGVLMYTRANPPSKVLRSREEVNMVLRKFHDKGGHHGYLRCQKAILNDYFWASHATDLIDWITNCDMCIKRTKRRKYQCSVYRCTNYSGPVERSLGISFHEYPVHNPVLLEQWLKMIDRPNWVPRPMSSICSKHFIEDSFDRTGDTVTLKPDAVPGLFLFKNPFSHHPAGSTFTMPILEDVTTQDQAFFAKYDAVERYLRNGVYPPGVNSVEKNTIRRFCKNYIIKDDLLYWVKGTKVRQVLRSREAVNTALTDYHDELNHLNLKKCMRLLSEKYFWSTIKADVVRWIDKCSECSKTKETEPCSGRATETAKPMEPMKSLRIIDHPVYSRSTISVAKRNVIICKDSTGFRLLEPIEETMAPFDTIQFVNCTEPSSSTISVVSGDNSYHIDSNYCNEEVTHHEEDWASPVEQSVALPAIDPGNNIDPQCLTSDQQAQVMQPSAISDSGPVGVGTPKPQPQSEGSTPKPQPQCKSITSLPKPSRQSKRKSPEPVVTVSKKPWLVCVVSKQPMAQGLSPLVESTKATMPSNVSGTVPSMKPTPLQARTVIQQCTRAILRTKPVEAGTPSKWVEIAEGMVIYVCFLNGAAMEIIPKMVDILLNTKMFQSPSTKLQTSILQLPGSVLVVPQNTLSGESVVKKRFQYTEVVESRQGAQLYAEFVMACKKAMASVGKCKAAGVSVQHGVYGNKQDIDIRSKEPLTHLLEF